MVEETPNPPKMARRAIALLATGALCGMTLGAYFHPLSTENAGLLGTLSYTFAAIVLGYMGAQVAPDVFKK